MNKALSAEATVTGLLTIAVDSETGKLHFLGAVRAKGKVKFPGGSVGFDLFAEVDDCVLVFDLPHIGLARIPLPC